MTVKRNNVVGIKQLIRSQLLAVPEIKALVEERIWTAHPKSSDVRHGTVKMPGIVLETTDGFSRYSGVLQDVTLNIWCYAVVSATEAEDLYNRLVFPALQAQHLYNNTVGASGDKVISQICVSREVTRPVDGFDERFDAWYFRGRWSIMAKG